MTKSNLSFDSDQAFAMLNSTEPFPVDFDFAWPVCGYSTKTHATRKLTSTLVENQDYVILSRSGQNSQPKRRGRPSVSYALTIDGFKHFGMLAQTEEGRNIRQYFIEAEKQLLTIANVESLTPEQTLSKALAGEITVLPSGQHIVTVNAYERVSGLGHSTLHRGLTNESHPLHKKLVSRGFDTADIKSWSSNGVPDSALITVTEYYAEHSPIDNQKVQHLFKALHQLGGRAFLQRFTSNTNAQDMAEMKQQMTSMMGMMSEMLDRQRKVDSAISNHIPGIANIMNDATSNGYALMPPSDYKTATILLRELAPMYADDSCFLSGFPNHLASFYKGVKGRLPDKRSGSYGPYVYGVNDRAIVQQAIDSWVTTQEVK